MSPGKWPAFNRYLYTCISFKQNSGDRFRATWPTCLSIHWHVFILYKPLEQFLNVRLKTAIQNPKCHKFRKIFEFSRMFERQIIFWCHFMSDTMKNAIKYHRHRNCNYTEQQKKRIFCIFGIVYRLRLKIMIWWYVRYHWCMEHVYNQMHHKWMARWNNHNKEVWLWA